MATIAEDVKKLLGGTQDEKLEVVERRTKSRLASILGVSEVPASFETIVYEVTVKRFNRIGNEGMQSYSQEGLSMAFPESDFAEYQGEIDDWLNAQKDEEGEVKRGRFRLY
ncbi:phage head-tail connector protein [Enterococcus sp. MJM12]|uniref:Phage head-tail connector protein n=1 Tax=Candidatus Enterococcus myersii TaxID=2815322 RepID=A0ABS3H7B6_9ENTE|nr:phage head-tail connector protein [Enterococcus sp. MJM12]MBO0449353.1 phage head-tail connector protein [Enterococcus sp. MJM12]